MVRKKVDQERSRVMESSGNVYEDLGFPDAGTELAKAQLASRIVNVFEDRELTQQQSAELLGIDQPAVSQVSLDPGHR